MAKVKFPNRDLYIRDNVWLVRQEIGNNRSLLHWQFIVDDDDPYRNWSSGSAARWMKINGGFVHEFYGNGFDFGSRGSYILAEGEVWVPHNGDGTKTVTINAIADFDILGQTPELVQNITLPTIARASTATFSPSSALTAGTAVTINTNRASSSFTHKIMWAFGQTTGEITGVGASVSWTPPLSLLTQIPDSTSGAGAIWTETYSGATRIGSVRTNFTLTAPASVVPTISPLTGSDTNPLVASVVGAYVQNLSRLQVGVSASGAQGSTITAREVTVAGVTGSPSTAFALPSSGTVNISAKVTDSRGRTATRAGSVSVLAYTPPAVSSVNVRRATSAGVVGVDEPYLRIDLAATVKSLVNSTERNGMTIKVRTRPTNGAWTNRNTITGALSYNSNFVVSGGAVFPPTSSYDVEISVTDKVGQSWVRIVTIPTAAVAIDINGVKVGIGKLWENGALDVAGDIYQNGNLVVDVTRTATTSATGVVELATNAEAQAGTDTTRAVTPAALASVTATETRDGLVELATPAEVNAGTDTVRAVTPHKLRRMSHLPFAVAGGEVSHPSVPAINGVTVTVTLPAGRFNVIPTIQATSQVAQTLTLAPITKSTTSFTLRASNWFTSAQAAGTIGWLAIQMTETAAAG